MTWREITIAKILLLIAKIISEDDELTLELKNLSNHISATGRAE